MLIQKKKEQNIYRVFARIKKKMLGIFTRLVVYIAKRQITELL